MSAWTYLEKLSELPHRGSASGEEATAAGLIAANLQSMGYTVDRQHFRGPRKTLYYGPALVMAIFVFAGLGLGAERPGLALLLMLLTSIPLLGELLGWFINLDAILPKHRSQNVITTNMPAPDSGTGEKTRVYITAHFDTQFGTWLFAPFFRPYLQLFFTLSYIALGALPVALASRTLFPAAPLVGEVLWISAIYLTFALSWLLINAVSGQFINGANDNGSGVALALAMAEKAAQGHFPALDPCFVFTGSEETGSRGMIRFISELDQPDSGYPAYFVNLDNLGAGQPRYLEGEGMLRYTPYNGELIELAKRVSDEKARRVIAQHNLLLPTDGVFATHAGFPAITFIAMDATGRIPEYHWHTDKIDKVDPELIAYMEEYLSAYLCAIPSLRKTA